MIAVMARIDVGYFPDGELSATVGYIRVTWPVYLCYTQPCPNPTFPLGSRKDVIGNSSKQQTSKMSGVAHPQSRYLQLADFSKVMLYFACIL